MLVAALVGTASAAPHRATRDGLPVAHHVKRAHVLIKSAYSPKRWEDPTPAKGSEKRAWQSHRRAILIETTRQQIGEFRDRHRRLFDQYRASKLELASLTPYPGPNGTHWAIPWSIVSCESGGSWTAANPSGAIGPYQLLGKGAPWPVTSEADKMEHHRIASELWAGGAGRSHWVC